MTATGQAVLVALLGIAAVAFVDRWSLPGALLGIVLGIVVGLTLRPEPTPTMPGPVTALRRRVPSTAPRGLRLAI